MRRRQLGLPWPLWSGAWIFFKALTPHADQLGLNPLEATVLLVAGFVCAVVTVPLFGGNLTRLADAPFRLGPLLAGALGIQILVISIVPGGPPWLWATVHLATYAMLAVVVAANRHLPGMRALAVGGAMNVTAMLANGGVMPATTEALQTAGLATRTDEFVNSGVVDGARLSFLGDVFAIPASWPLANVFSVGDVLIAVGGWCAVHALCGSGAVGWNRRRHARQLDDVVSGDRSR